MALAVAGLWSARRPIATDIIDRKLAEWGVPARYKIDKLGLGRQRLTHVVLGDPAHPDLVADWVELDTHLGFDGASVVGVRAGHVRLRGRLTNGALSLGSIDKLMPPPSGKPFALPDIDLTVDDGRMRLETPQGVVGLKLSGSGRLNDGFKGHLAAVSERMEAGGCVAERLAAVVKLSVAAAQPRLDGPIRAARFACGAARGDGVVIDQATTLGTALDSWEGAAQISLAGVKHPEARLADLAGRIDYSGSMRRTTGHAELAAATIATTDATGRDARISGEYRFGAEGAGFTGQVGTRLAVADKWRRAAGGVGGTAAGTPVAPLLARLGKASAAALADLKVTGNASLAMAGKGGSLSVGNLQARSTSGAVATLSGGKGVAVDWQSGAVQADGLLAVSGGGLPDVAMRVRRGADGAMTGSGLVRPYAAGNARLALDRLEVSARPGGPTRFATLAVLSGPLGDGRLEGARVPLTGVWNGSRLAINPACTPVSADRLAMSGLDLDRPHLTLCPAGQALVVIAGSRVTGGAHAEDVALAGTLGGTPLVLKAAQATADLGTYGFVLKDVETRLGEGDQATPMGAATLDGRFEHGKLAGHLTGGAGQIANVPLLMSDAAGDWHYADGRLTLTGALMVADGAESPRFVPAAGREVALTLADSRIDATGVVVNPASQTLLGSVHIVHDLSSGAGHADMDVPGVAFGKGLQPNQLTPLTYGVIADVKGTVSGEGHIRWTKDGVTSDGVFRTPGTDLAAAFGPVQGLATEVRFTDLLNMVSAPGQVATVAVVNPGVEVDNGVVRYTLLKDQRVDVQGAEWPFAGGRLVLDPTLLDFAEHQERHLTFRVEGVDAALFLQQFNFSNLNATGTFDGTLPMIFNEKGGRIEGGHLTVREKGGNIAYVGELSQEDLGFWGNMAFQSLKSLDYRSLSIDMNGPIDGEVITDVRFAGVSQGRGAKSNFVLKRLSKLPFVFNVRITAPFRQLFNAAHDIYDPRDLIRRNMPGATVVPPDGIPTAHNSIQPRESEKHP